MDDEIVAIERNGTWSYQIFPKDKKPLAWSGSSKQD